MKKIRTGLLILTSISLSNCGLIDERYESYKDSGPASSATDCGAQALALFSTAFTAIIPTNCLGCHGAGLSGSSYLTLGTIEDENRKAIFKKSKFDGTAFLTKIQGSSHTGRAQAAALDLALVTAWTDKEKACFE